MSGLTSDERLVFMRQGGSSLAADSIATSRIEAAVTRAVVAIAEWSDSTGQIRVGSHEHADFAAEIAAAIRGVEA